LVAVPLPKNPNSLEIDQDRAMEVAKHMSEQYMKLLYATASQTIGVCILQAGLVGKKDSVNLARMLRAACRGAHKATLDEAEAIAKEHKEKGMLA
jgi:hypothetical protein